MSGGPVVVSGGPVVVGGPKRKISSACEKHYYHLYRAYRIYHRRFIMVRVHLFYSII